MDRPKRLAAWGMAAVVVIAAVAAFAAGAQPELDTETELTKYEGIFRTLFPDAGDSPDGFNQLDDKEKLTYAVSRGGEILGHTVVHTVQGYGGPIELVVGIRTDGTLAGVHVGGDAFRETEGLGAKAKEPAFTDQFQRKQLPLTLGKDIDAIAGATITSRAIVDGVNDAASAHGVFSKTVNASAIGYGGPVLVRMTLGSDGKIASLDIGGVRFAETDGVGSKVREDDFVQQFIGKTPPLMLGQDIDAVSGATVSSQAAVDAVNDGAAFLKDQ